MKPWIALALVVLVASPFAVVALDSMGIGPGFKAHAPVWSSGHTWTYDVTASGRAQGQIFGLVSGATETASTEATRRAEVLNTTLQENGVPLYAVLEAFRIDRVKYGDEVLFDGKKDGYGNAGPHAGDMATDFFCITPCGTALVPYTREHTNPFLGLIDETGTDQVRLLDFPLTRGKEWTVIAADEDDLHIEIRARAVEQEYINPPNLRPVEAIRIEAELTEASKQAIQALAHGAAADEDVDLDTDFDLRFTYWYSPKVENIVRIDTTSFVAARASGMGIAGTGRIDFSLTQVLASYSLAEKPERSLDHAHALAQIAEADGGNTAETSTLQPWTFTAVTSTGSVEAGDGTEVSLGTRDGVTDDTAQGGYENPRALRIEWTHSHWENDRTVHERIDAESFDATLDDPGLHTFTARAYDSKGRLVGADTVQVEAYSRHHCAPEGPAAIGAVQATYSVCEVPTAPGALQLTVSRESALLAKGLATVTHDGDELAAGNLDEPILVEATDRPGRWIILYEDELRVGPVELTAEVRYPRTDAAATPTGSLPDAGFLKHPLLERLAGLL